RRRRILPVGSRGGEPMDRRMDDSQATFRVLAQIARLPIDAFALGVGLFFRTIQGLQSMMTPGMGSTTGSAPGPGSLAGASGTWGPMPPGSAPGGIDAPIPMDPTRPNDSGPIATASSSFRENDTMDDQDLGGDDLKVVRYRILFTKPDLEVTFREKQELINYPTNGGSLGGLKVGQFMGQVEKGEVDR